MKMAPAYEDLSDFPHNCHGIHDRNVIRFDIDWITGSFIQG